MPGEWSDYRFFLAVARLGSLSAAARHLRVDQSTVGRRLAALQAQCGARLFDFTPDGYVLTAAGESVRGTVEQIEAQFLTVERQLAGRDTSHEGVLRLATTETFATSFLVPRISRLRVKHPRLLLEIVTDNHPVDLARREADLALRVGIAPKQPNLVVRKLGMAGFALFAAPSYLAKHGRPRNRLSGHALVGYSGELAHGPLGRWIETHAGEAEIVMRANSVDVVYEAVAAGVGLGVLPCLFADHGVERVTKQVVGTAPVIAVAHEDMIRSARVRAVLEFLAELVRDERALLAG